MDNSIQTNVQVRVIPRSSKNSIKYIAENGSFKIHVTSPPEKGKANKAVVAYLSDILHISQREVEIISGFKNRNKIISIHGLDMGEILELVGNS